ncbi:CoA ester lyase [Frigidibacter sp. MR17.14]|uniref:HpcH/HpaI aldolase/citrate lyase family protein n=1 Tax=Frigidibacter sp. MR17.14 TaxID=3126509 RepID=UPI003012F2B6
MLFVPADSARKFAKARGSDADALILDLEDSVAAEAKDGARATLAEMLAAPRDGGPQIWVRVNALDTGRSAGDLAAAMPGRPAGIVLPKCEGAGDLRRLSHMLDALEAAHGIAEGATGIVSVATETGAAVLNLAGHRGATPRLRGMMWGAEDLAADLGATTNSDGTGFSEPFRLARNLCLMAAAAAGVAAIDTVATRIDDLDHVEAEARAARRDGFAAKAVIHPSHIAPVNRAFTPTPDERAWAEAVIAAFAAAPASGVVKIDGRMIDKPHERAARRILGAGAH